MVWMHFSSLRVSNYQKTTRTSLQKPFGDSDWISSEEYRTENGGEPQLLLR